MCNYKLHVFVSVFLPDVLLVVLPTEVGGCSAKNCVMLHASLKRTPLTRSLGFELQNTASRVLEVQLLN